MTGTLAPYGVFVKSFLPLYHGPQAVIKLGTATYKVSKALLTGYSSYFAAMFDGNFKEGEEQSADLQEIEGVLLTRSFEILLQWMYLGRVLFEERSPTDRISAMIEFSRLADMLATFEHITTRHIDAVSRLPKRHPVRLLFPKAAVEGYINSKSSKIVEVCQQIPEFSADLLVELRSVLGNVTAHSMYNTSYFTDPLTGEKRAFRRE
ncbi:hypothetical protein BJX61DRAFT_538144 [Aspergillus egyptiacus]|nr:hypothetical protein BJX61DRAFT_538144 [Aspergillus egyptiacus]